MIFEIVVFNEKDYDIKHGTDGFKFTRKKCKTWKDKVAFKTKIQ